MNFGDVGEVGCVGGPRPSRFVICRLSKTQFLESRMKPFAFLLAQLASTFLVASTLAQETTWQPSRFPPFNFRDVAAAKIYENDNGSAVLGLISPTTNTRTVPVTKTRTETRHGQRALWAR